MSSCLMQADLLVSVHTYEKISNVVAWKRHIKYFVDKVTYFAFNPSGHIRSTLLSSWHWTFIIESKNMIEKDFIIAPDRWKFSTQLKMILKKNLDKELLFRFLLITILDCYFCLSTEYRLKKALFIMFYFANSLLYILAGCSYLILFKLWKRQFFQKN